MTLRVLLLPVLFIHIPKTEFWYIFSFCQNSDFSSPRFRFEMRHIGVRAGGAAAPPESGNFDFFGQTPIFFRATGEYVKKCFFQNDFGKNWKSLRPPERSDRNPGLLLIMRWGEASEFLHGQGRNWGVKKLQTCPFSKTCSVSPETCKSKIIEKSLCLTKL